jgi:opacity protein-like surface antigen
VKPESTLEKNCMKMFAVIALVVIGLACQPLAEAAPKKRTSSQNRVGPYVFGMAGMTSYSGSHDDLEQQMRDILTANELPFQNLVSTTDDSDIGYQIGAGYRFMRYFAAELAFAQFGELTTTASAEVDYPQDETGFEPSDLELSYETGGPVFSAIGILPINDRVEVYGRLGLVFASFKRSFASRVNGQTLSGSARSDSQNTVYGAGLSWNINKVYALRAEYEVIKDIGDTGVGTEDLEIMGLQFSMRF